MQLQFLPPHTSLIYRWFIRRRTFNSLDTPSSGRKIRLRKSCYFLFPVQLKVLSTVRSKRYAKSTEESAEETSTGDNDDEDSGHDSYRSSDEFEKAVTGGSKRNVSSLSDALNLGSRDPVYEVVEVSSKGMVSTRKINRRLLLKSSGLRPRDIRSVDPSLWLTNTMPSLLVVEAALNSRIQHFEHRLMDLDPHVQDLLKVLPNRLTAGILEQLQDSQEIRRLCIVGRNCFLNRNTDVERSVPLDKQIDEEEEEEIEMLLENYLHRCESYHNQAGMLLDSAREMEDSIAVNLSSRRLQVSRFELLLQVGTFCLAVGALVSVCVLAYDRRNYIWCHSGIFSHLLVPEGKENPLGERITSS
ncbi:hypothetical protein L1987_04716 [Smallanthus sonchifolius]|uniref:Uncharacterized protein n=1 Tax=Smallanthus sonchifolius TaxID=185202 RepID=A0ACB9JTE6_9ASTR|nr:hypothetical protein L1987_04716 [Smallanthus sonchifolius]